jgi:tRNA threonylcarbamoyladenosine biosynthesis protein TsaB
MRILVIDSALAGCTAAVVQDEVLRAHRRVPAARGQASVLPVLVEEVMREAALSASQLDLIAATVGPGSFTGVRAGLALAHGIGVAAGRPVIGVTVGEALSEALPRLGHRELWIAIGSRRGRVFLARPGADGGRFAGVGLDALPMPGAGAAVAVAVAVAVAGDAAIPVAAFLAARARDVMLTDARHPQARQVALVAARRFAGELPALAAQPLYVDPPEAKLPAGGLRPPPA